MGPIPPAESSVRYYQAPSPLLTPGLGVTPVAEKLVSIGSIPKQAASEGFHATGSLRAMIPGVQEQRSWASSSTFAEKATAERRQPGKRSLQSRTSTRRNLVKGRVSKNSPSRVSRRSTLRQREGLKERSRSARLTSKRTSAQQRHEIKALRREVKAL